MVAQPILHSECCGLVNHPLGASAWLPKVKSLQALFALATEVLRLFGDFADQVSVVLEGGLEGEWLNIKFLPRVYGILQ